MPKFVVANASGAPLEDRLFASSDRHDGNGRQWEAKPCFDIPGRLCAARQGSPFAGT